MKILFKAGSKTHNLIAQCLAGHYGFKWATGKIGDSVGCRLLIFDPEDKSINIGVSDIVRNSITTRDITVLHNLLEIPVSDHTTQEGQVIALTEHGDARIFARDGIHVVTQKTLASLAWHAARLSDLVQQTSCQIDGWMRLYKTHPSINAIHLEQTRDDGDILTVFHTNLQDHEKTQIKEEFGSVKFVRTVDDKVEVETTRPTESGSGGP